MVYKICDNHGSVGFTRVCQHLNAELQSGIFGTYRELTSLPTDRFCAVCWTKYDIAFYDNHPDFREKDDIEILESPVFVKYIELSDRIVGNIWCDNCLAEIEVEQARHNCQPASLPE